jgi:dihydropyrimidinase
MTAFDLIRAASSRRPPTPFACDVGIRDGRIAALGHDLGPPSQVIDARRSPS